MKVLDDNFMVCSDCIQVIANGDYSGLDYSCDVEEKFSEKRVDEINAGLEDNPGIACGDADKDEEFSTQPCECCGESLHGSRHHCVILG